MVRQLAFIGAVVSLFASGALARDESILARVTVYWPGEGGHQACSNGARLRPGHCAVDPNEIPYGSRVLFDDATCVAVDTGPAVVNRKAARLSGRNQREGGDDSSSARLQDPTGQTISRCITGERAVEAAVLSGNLLRLREDANQRSWRWDLRFEIAHETIVGADLDVTGSFFVAVDQH